MGIWCVINKYFNFNYFAFLDHYSLSVSEAKHSQGCGVLPRCAPCPLTLNSVPQLSLLMVVGKWTCLLVMCVTRVETLQAGSSVKLRDFSTLIRLFVLYIFTYLHVSDHPV